MTQKLNGTSLFYSVLRRNWFDDIFITRQFHGDPIIKETNKE